MEDEEFAPKANAQFTWKESGQSFKLRPGWIIRKQRRDRCTELPFQSWTELFDKKEKNGIHMYFSDSTALFQVYDARRKCPIRLYK